MVENYGKVKRAAIKAVDKLVEDISDRDAIGNAWCSISRETQHWLRLHWADIITEEMDSYLNNKGERSEYL